MLVEMAIVNTPLSRAQYPESAIVEELDSCLEIKKWWLYNEWDPTCQFSVYVQKAFPNKSDLHPQEGNADISLIESTFNNVRGKYSLWGSEKEEARWEKVTVEDLKLTWIIENVEVLYEVTGGFEVLQLNGLVFWKNPAQRKYQLLEGNHRVSAWIQLQEPESLPSIFFVGESSNHHKN